MFQLEHISFSWGDRSVLEDVSFSVAPGEVAVLTGANGAGKTTLMRIAAGVCRPASGTVSAGGADAWREVLRYRRQCGYLPEDAPVEDDMTVREFLRYRAALRGESRRRIRHRVMEAMDLCGLDPVADRRLDTLSRGLRKRAALADALLLRPHYLFLDDLMAGLDGSMRRSFGAVLKAVSSFAAVLVAGHELEELSQWATKYYVLKDGVAVGVKTVQGARTILSAPGGAK